MGAFGGPARTPVFRPAGSAGTDFLQLPHHAGVLGVAGRCAHRTQLPFRWHGLHPGGLGRIPRIQRRHPAQRRHGARNPAAERLRHRLDRQDPPHPDPRDHRRRTVRPVADGHGRGILLRLLRGRREPVVSTAVGELHADEGGQDSRRGLSLGSRHGRQDHRVHQPAEVHPSREAVDRLLRPQRAQAARRRARRVHRQIPRRVRRRLRRIAGPHTCAAEGARDRSCRHQARATARGAAAMGRDHRHRQGGRVALDGSLLRRARVHRSPDRAHRRGHRGDRRAGQHPHHLHRR